MGFNKNNAKKIITYIFFLLFIPVLNLRQFYSSLFIVLQSIGLTSLPLCLGPIV